MKSLTDIAKECGIQFGESDVSRDIISRRQLERVIAAALAQHQAKALEGVEPVAYRFTENRGNGYTEFNYYGLDEVGSAYRDNCLEIVPLYSAATVSALQARIATQAEHQAKALEGVEPVAVVGEVFNLFWAGSGPIAPMCEKHGITVGQPLYSAATVSALQARIATQAEHQAKALEGVQAFEFDPPPYNSAAMGCGLEDRGATDIYDAMYYGWHEAMDRAYESIPDDLVSATTVSALRERIAELEQDAARGQVKCHKGAVVREFENEIGNRIKITIEGPTSTSENILTPMEATELRRALIAAAPKETP